MRNETLKGAGIGLTIATLGKSRYLAGNTIPLGFQVTTEVSANVGLFLCILFRIFIKLRDIRVKFVFLIPQLKERRGAKSSKIFYSTSIRTILT